MLEYCFSQLKDLKYVLIKDHDVKECVNPYKVVPRIWITGSDDAFYPITFGKGQACWVDHIIKECEKPLPKKKFKKINMQEVFDSGIMTIIKRYLCSCVMKIFVSFPEFRRLRADNGFTGAVSKRTRPNVGDNWVPKVNWRI